MKAISCKAELLTERYEFLRKNMSSSAKFSIFPANSWGEPWGFGRDNKHIALRLYNEFMQVQDLDTIDNVSEFNCSDEVIIALRTEDAIGIVYIAEDEGMFKEYMEDILNYITMRNDLFPANVPEPKKPDNLVIPRMHIFK